MGVWGEDHGIIESRKNEADLVLSAYRSMRSPIAYVSMPITSGALLYDVLDEYGCKTIEELKKIDPSALSNKVIMPNIEIGTSIADNIREISNLPPIAPSVFEAKKQRWSQEEYMFLWFNVIVEKAQQMYMTPKWGYTNGGAQEFVRAMEMQYGFITPNNGMKYLPDSIDKEELFEQVRKIKVYDHKGKELRIDEGAKNIKDAIIDLHDRGFGVDSLCESFHKLASIVGYLNDPFTSRKEWEHACQDGYNPIEILSDWKDFTSKFNPK